MRGFGAGGFFDTLANDLPEPAMLDEVSERARHLETLLKQATNVQVAKKPPSQTEVAEVKIVDAPKVAPSAGDELGDLF